MKPIKGSVHGAGRRAKNPSGARQRTPSGGSSAPTAATASTVPALTPIAEARSRLERYGIAAATWSDRVVQWFDRRAGAYLARGRAAWQDEIGTDIPRLSTELTEHEWPGAMQAAFLAGFVRMAEGGYARSLLGVEAFFRVAPTRGTPALAFTLLRAEQRDRTRSVRASYPFLFGDFFAKDLRACPARWGTRQEIVRALNQLSRHGYSYEQIRHFIRLLVRHWPRDAEAPFQSMFVADQRMRLSGISRPWRAELLLQALHGPAAANLERLQRFCTEAAPDEIEALFQDTAQLQQRLQALWWFFGSPVGPFYDVVTRGHIVWLVIAMSTMPTPWRPAQGVALGVLARLPERAGLDPDAEPPAMTALALRMTDAVEAPTADTAGPVAPAADAAGTTFNDHSGWTLRAAAALASVANTSEEILRILRRLDQLATRFGMARNWIMRGIDRTDADLAELIEELCWSRFPVAIMDAFLAFVDDHCDRRSVKVLSRAAHFLQRTRERRWPVEMQAAVLQAAIGQRGERAQRFLARLSNQLFQRTYMGMPLDEQLREIEGLLHAIGLDRAAGKKPRRPAAPERPPALPEPPPPAPQSQTVRLRKKPSS